MSQKFGSRYGIPEPRNGSDFSSRCACASGIALNRFPALAARSGNRDDFSLDFSIARRLRLYFLWIVTEEWRTESCRQLYTPKSNGPGFSDLARGLTSAGVQKALSHIGNGSFKGERPHHNFRYLPYCYVPRA